MLNNLPVKVSGDQMWNKVLSQEFSKGSADGIKELRFYLVQTTLTLKKVMSYLIEQDQDTFGIHL